MCRKTLLIAALIVGVISTALVPVGTAAAMESPTDGDARSGPDETVLRGQYASQEVNNSSTAPPDPEDDVIGWENGYWYNESIDVDQSDGLSEAELDRYVARTMARIERIRGLEFKENETIEFISREEMKDIARERSFGENTNNQLWEALFIVGEDADAAAVHAETMGAGVLGYAAEEGSETLILVTKDPDKPMVTPDTLAHELVHMLQDQHFNLSRPRYQRTTHDGEFGKDGVVEGEATLVHKLYLQECQGSWDCVDTPNNWADTERGGNWGISYMGYQPYSDGAVWVNSLYESGGWEAVNDAHRSPPTSSEATIHYQNSDEQPVEMAISDTSREGWAVQSFDGHRAERLGEVSIFTMFFYQHRVNGVDAVIGEFSQQRDGQFDVVNYSTDAAEGWGNDRLLVYENDDEAGYVWKTVWDTETDAAEFQEAYLSLLDAHDAAHPSDSIRVIENGRFADAFRVVKNGKTVTIVNGPTVDSLDDIRLRSEDNSGAGTTATATTEDTEQPTTESAADTTVTEPAEETTTNDGPVTTATGGDNGSTPGFGLTLAIGAVIAAIGGFAFARRRR